MRIEDMRLKFQKPALLRTVMEYYAHNSFNKILAALPDSYDDVEIITYETEIMYNLIAEYDKNTKREDDVFNYRYDMILFLWAFSVYDQKKDFCSRLYSSCLYLAQCGLGVIDVPQLTESNIKALQSENDLRTAVSILSTFKLDTYRLSSVNFNERK